METFPDKETASIAHCHNQLICSLNFLSCLAVTETFVGLTYHLSVYLRSSYIDARVTLEQVYLVLTKLEEIGTNAEAELHKIFSPCQDRAAEFEVKFEISRVVGTQKYWANHPRKFPKEYYRRATLMTYIYLLKASPKWRFANHRKALQSMEFVLPKHASRANLNLCIHLLILVSRI